MRSWDDWLLTLQGKQRPIERHQKGEGIFEPKDTEEGVLLMIWVHVLQTFWGPWGDKGVYSPLCFYRSVSNSLSLSFCFCFSLEVASSFRSFSLLLSLSPSSPFFIPLNPLSPPLFPPHLASSPPPIPLLRSSRPPGYSIFLCYHLERSLFHACSNFFHRFIFLFVSLFPSCFAVVSFSLSLCFFLLPHFLSSWVCFLILCLSSSLSPSCFIFNPHDVKSSHPHLLTIPGFFLL